MPIHMNMLSLVGYEFRQRDMVRTEGLNARKRAMMAGLHSLRKRTGVDFGYDAAAWREYLIEHGDEFGYTHPYAYASVDRAVLAALEDAEVVQAFELLSQESS